MNIIKPVRIVFLSILFNFTALNLLFSQNSAPTIEWETSIGGSGYDKAFSIKQTSDGGYITAGISYSDDADFNLNQGGSDCAIAKLSSTGNLEWTKSFGGTFYEAAKSILQTTDGGYLFVGYSSSSTGDVSNPIGGWDVWVVKLDNLGDIEWEKSLGGTQTEWASSVQQTSDGGYILAGYSRSNNGDVSGNNGSDDCWIVKLNSTGVIQWQKTFGGSENDEATYIQETSDGGFIFAGHTLSNNGNVSGNHGISDSWIVKLDINGTLEWQKTLGGSNTEIAYSISQTTDGGYIVGGFSNSTDGNVSAHPVGGNAWIVKLNNTGIIEWQKTYGGSDYDFINAILQSSNGDFLIAGHTYSSDGDVVGNHGSVDGWLACLSNWGALKWQKPLGGSSRDSIASMIETSDGSIILAGSSKSSDGDVAFNNGDEDFWIVKLSPTVGIRDFTETTLDWKVYPNPCFNSFQIDLDTENPFLIEVSNLLGDIIYSKNSDQMTNTIDVENWSSGVYFVSIKDEKSYVLSTRKIVINGL
ncbi:MAG: T9SS type A sorting domain-containing protein [Chitinophagales bacterium]|nr:T9SS type A sorting domain-containing protein [Chitinophagales bacterium]